MAEPSVLTPSIIKYVVGEDLTTDRYNEIIQGIGDWFAQSRRTKAPVVLAKKVVDACLEGVKPSDGTPWQTAALASLEKRIRMAAQFDISTMTPMKTASQKQRDRKERQKVLRQRRKEERAVDTNYPDEYNDERIANAAYGDDPRVFFTAKERKTFKRKREGLLAKFPQLDNVAQESKVDMYTTLQILFERLQFRTLAAGSKKNEVKATEREMQDLTKQIVDLEKALGIDPITLHKTQETKEGGSIGEAIRRFESMEDYKDLRLKWWAEELLILYTMFMTASPRSDMSGYQLDEVGLYGLTKTRVVECPHCGNKNWAGFKIKEIEAWLLANGHLKPAPNKEAGDYLQSGGE